MQVNDVMLKEGHLSAGLEEVTQLQLTALAQVIVIGEVKILDFSQGVGQIACDEAVEAYHRGEYDGVIFRFTSAGRRDEQFENNVDCFGSNDVPYGGYGWHNPQASAGQNASQAHALVDCVNYIGKVPPLRVHADHETNASKLDINGYRQAVLKYDGTYDTEIGEYIGEYTNVGTWDACVANAINGNTDIPDHHPLIAAAWHTTPNYPYIPYDWRKVGGVVLSHEETWLQHPERVPMWQYIGDGWVVNWALSPVDLITFNGSRADYWNYFKLGEPMPDPNPNPDPQPTVQGLWFIVTNLKGLNLRKDPVAPGGKILKTVPVNTKLQALDVAYGLANGVPAAWISTVDGWACVQQGSFRYLKTVQV